MIEITNTSNKKSVIIYKYYDKEINYENIEIQVLPNNNWYRR